MPGLICVVCGNKVDALFRQYGPTVLKVTNCDRCGSIADKYIEYDPVIIIVDLVLLSMQAYRHVLYNTPFKAYWKLFIVLLLMDTYIDWSRSNENKSYSIDYFNTALSHVESKICQENLALTHNSSESWLNSPDVKSNEQQTSCKVSSKKKKSMPTDDPFLTEKGIYLTFCCIFFGMLAFVLWAFISSTFLGLLSLAKNKVKLEFLFKAFTLGSIGNLLMLPTLIWGSDRDTSIHSVLVWGYTTLALTNVHSVIFDCSKWKSFFILIFSSALKVSVSTYLRTASEMLM